MTRYIPSLTFILLLLFAYLGYCIIHNAPEVTTLKQLEIPQTNKETVLGSKELGQRSGAAEERHLAVRYLEKKWEIANVSQTKKVEAQTNLHRNRYLKRWQLREGDSILLCDVRIKVHKADRTGLTLVDIGTKREVLWHNGVLTAGGKEFVYKECQPFWQRAKRNIRWWLRSVQDDKEIVLFSMGGGVNCPDRWKLEDVPPQALQVIWYNDKYWLAPGQENTPVLMARKGQKTFKNFQQLWLPLSGKEETVRRLIIGYTYYWVKVYQDKIILTPFRNKFVFFKDEADFKPAYQSLKWIGQCDSLVDWPKQRIWELGIILFFVAGGTYALWYHHQFVLRRLRRLPLAFTKKIIALAPALLFIPLTLLMWRDRSTLDLSELLLMAWLAWVWATVLFTLNRRLIGISGWLWVIVVFLAGAGTLTMTQLAAGADNTQWLDYARKHILLITAFAWFISLLNGTGVSTLEELWIRFSSPESGLWAFLRWVLALSVLILLFLQLVFGNEHGLWGIQPAEAAKLLLVVMAGFTGMHIHKLRDMNSKEFLNNPFSVVLNFLKIILFIVIAVVFVLVSIRDLSPILIITFFSLFWIWKIAPHPWKQNRTGFIIRISIVLVMVFSFGLVWWIHSNPDALPYQMPQRDRLLVWAEPQKYPHSGEQILNAMTLAGRGGWLGPGASWFGINGDVMRLPRVHNDFIGSFVVFKFGGLTCIVFVLVQLAFIGLLLKTSEFCRKWVEEKSNLRQLKSGLTLELVLYGMAWMHFLHWGIAWSNVLGILPVMGQPMTWISSGNSHMVFFTLPAVLIGMIAGCALRQDICPTF